MPMRYPAERIASRGRSNRRVTTIATTPAVAVLASTPPIRALFSADTNAACTLPPIPGPDMP